LDENGLQELLGKWPSYSQVVSWVCNELKAVMKIDEAVNVIQASADVSIFQLELSSLLKGVPEFFVLPFSCFTDPL